MLRAQGEPSAVLRPVLEAALRFEGPARRDLSLYEELGRLLTADDPPAAVELYCSFPFGAGGAGSDAFGENGLRLAAAKLMLRLEMFDDPRLAECLVGVGRRYYFY